MAELSSRLSSVLQEKTRLENRNAILEKVGWPLHPACMHACMQACMHALLYSCTGFPRCTHAWAATVGWQRAVRSAQVSYA